MNYVRFILLSMVLSAHASAIFAKNADVICTYKERVRTDVTQQPHTQSITHKNATDIDCCTETDATCLDRMQKSAKDYCRQPERVPQGYKFSSVKVMCGKGFIGGEKGIEYTAE